MATLFSEQKSYNEPYQNHQCKYGYLNKRIILPNQVIALPCFPDLSIDLGKVFSPKVSLSGL